jgi:NUMOD3 motif
MTPFLLGNQMFYYVYKTTNLVNGRFYVGKHTASSLDNDYLGSGLLINRAIEKHGRNNFQKEILEVYDQEWKMNLAERILVVIDTEVSYNLKLGGQGGWDFVNKNGLVPKKIWLGRKHSEETIEKMKHPHKGYKKRLSMSEEQKLKISLAHLGKKKPWVAENNRITKTKKVA